MTGTGSSTVTVVAVVGILAAIALPVYQDYIARSQVSEAIVSTSAAKLAITEHYFSAGELPDSLEELGVQTSSRYGELYWNDGVLVVQMHEHPPVNSRIQGQTVGLSLTDNGSWVCGYAEDAAGELVGGSPSDATSLAGKFLPSSCR